MVGSTALRHASLHKVNMIDRILYVRSIMNFIKKNLKKVKIKVIHTRLYV